MLLLLHAMCLFDWLQFCQSWRTQYSMAYDETIQRTPKQPSHTNYTNYFIRLMHLSCYENYDHTLEMNRVNVQCLVSSSAH